MISELNTTVQSVCLITQGILVGFKLRSFNLFLTFIVSVVSEM